MQLVCYPSEQLRAKTVPVELNETTKDILTQITKEMFEILLMNQGLGLAANQVGCSFSLFVTNFENKQKVFINPKIVEQKGEQIIEEGCLSFPGLYRKVMRHRKIKVVAQDLNGETFIEKAKDLYASVLQHEIAHLNGRLLIDELMVR